MGGLEKVTVDLCNGLSERGISVKVGILARRGVLAGMLDKRITVWEAGVPRDTRFVDWTAVRALCRFVRASNATVVHAHNPKALQYALLVRLMTGLPLVYTLHGRGTSRKTFRALRREWIHACLCRGASHVVAISRDVRDKVVGRYRLSSDKVSLVLNGVDTERFSPLDSKQRTRLADRRGVKGIPERAFVVGSVGRLSTEKNYPLLIRAFANLVASGDHQDPDEEEKGRSPFLVLLGDGPDRGRIERTIRECGVTAQCLLPGAHPPEAWYPLMDTFCLPSDTEGTPITLLEAGACGLPCVVTDVGGNREVVRHGQSGLVVPCGGESNLKEALSRLKNDGDLRDRMGRAARQRVQDSYSLGTMVEQYETLYVALTSKG